MDRITFTRSELYTLVWKFPLLQIAKHYEISTMGIKNACDLLQVPLPKNKHWTGPEYKRKNIPELDKNYTGINQVAILKKRYEMQLRTTSKKTPLSELVENIKNTPNAPLKVLEKLENPVSIIALTKAYWESKAPDKEIKEGQNEILNLNVSNEYLNRALLFMDAFIKLIRFRGHEFGKSANGHDVVFLNNGIEMKVDLREALKRITHNGLRETSEYVFTGDFIFRISRGSNKKEWRDGRIALENNLALIVAKLELMGFEDYY